MLFPANSPGSLSTFFPTAEIRVLYPRRRSWFKFKSAHILVSGRIYWKEAKKDGTNQPQSLVDFQKANSLELVRLSDGSWKDVHEIVSVDNTDGRPRITVRGHLHGHTRLKKLFLVRNIWIQIIPETSEQLEVWMERIIARIAAWEFLEKQVRDAASHGHSTGVEELRNAFGELFTNRVPPKPSSMSMDNEWSDNPVYISEHIQKLSVVDEMMAHGIAAVETGATLTKLVACVECVAKTAEYVADASKCVAGVSTVFHLVALSARAVSMCAEANRGRRVLPVALGRIVILLRYVLESITEIMKSSRNTNELDKKFVFNVLRQTVCTMDIAETQLFRRASSQIMNAADVKEVERKIAELEPLVMVASNASRICAVGQEVAQLKQEPGNWDDGLHHVRPSVSALFSGRKKELNTLQDILEERGSAVISQYGGVGKTELMIAFADRVERDGQVPGGVFWVTVDGGVRDVIGALARLAEKLTRRKMSEDERRNANLVIASLKQGLRERQGRWLLCLDNADDSEVRGLLNEVCGIAEPMLQNGFVVVTSRQGQPRTWPGMKMDQKLVLEPLSAEDSMVALWRQSRVVQTRDASDDGVLKEIEKLATEDQDEHSALKELCGDDGAYSLGGLPLALVQAGAYIARFECSFREYQNMFKNANRKEDLQDIMKNTDELTVIRESQRSIWTTWKISVQRLSVRAYTVLRAMAMLGPAPVREAIVSRILKVSMADESGRVERKFRDVITEELVHGSSLICRDQGEGRGDVYKMHRLVQRFILSDMIRGSVMWNYVHSLALVAVHESVKTELEKEGKSFGTLPDVFENNYCEIAIHALALVHDYMLSERSRDIQNVSEIEDIHRYSGMVMRFMGKAAEEVQVWERLLVILHYQQEDNGSRSCIGRLVNTLFQRNRAKGLNSRIASVYDSLGSALMRTGELNRAASKLEKSLEMRREIHGYSAPHRDIASSLNSLGLVYRQMGELGNALEKHEQSLGIYLAIHGHDKGHLHIASSLNNLGLVHRQMGQLDNALEKHKRSLEMYRTIHGHAKPHPHIASSLNNLGLVYRQIDELEKALEQHEESIEIYQVVHGRDKPHPHIASSLNNLGLVYRQMGLLDKALEKHNQSLEMKEAIHGHGKPHPHIASSLNNLGLVLQETGKLENALEKHYQSLEMRRAIHGHGKPHPDTAISLCNIGLVHHIQKDLNQAAEFLERSLQMLRIVHAENLLHPHIRAVQSELAEVYEDQGRRDEALAIREQNNEIVETSSGEVSSHRIGAEEGAA